MPMTTTHALLPLAATLAMSRRPIRWALAITAAFAAAAPDLDGVVGHLWHLPSNSIYSHRGATHSVFVALAAGLIAACFSRQLRVKPLTAGTVVAAAMASHGILDMMADSGRGVAYLWPLTPVRLFASWRPIHSEVVQRAHFWTDLLIRFRSELWQLIIPTLAVALGVWACRAGSTKSPAEPPVNGTHVEAVGVGLESEQ